MPSVIYKEWLPDLPELNNPGLVKALNVLPKDGGFAPFLPFSSTGGIASTNAMLGSFMSSGVTKGAARIYGYSGDFYMGGFSSVFATRGSATGGGNGEQFAQYENLVIAVSEGHAPLMHTAGSASNFATLASSGTAPAADAIGIIGQFVVLGSLGTLGATQRPNVLQWSGIDQPRSWPTPNSATAIAQQSGEQELASVYGEVMAIHGGDQFAIVPQKSAVTRMTYVGPPAVFQFDYIERSQGSLFKNFSIMVGGVVYFVSALGFCRTNGVTVERIGAGKVDRFFWDNVDATKTAMFSCAYDQVNELIYFAYPSLSATGAFSADKLLIFNPKTNQWTHANQIVDELITSGNYVRIPPVGILAFSTAGSNSVVGIFEGTAGSAILETGDFELAEGGRGYIDGIKPHVESSGTAPAMGVRIGIRNDLGTAPTYTSTAGPNSRTGFANFRDKGVTDGKYARVELNITGTFKKVTGFEIDADPSGQT